MYIYLYRSQWQKKLMPNHPKFADGRMAIAQGLSNIARPAAHFRSAQSPSPAGVSASGRPLSRSYRPLAARCKLAG